MENKNNFWQTEKGKATIKLCLWMVFIIVLIVVVIVSEKDNIHLPEENPGTTENEKENYDFVNYNDMLDKLLLNNYEYTYTITTIDSKFVYTGWKNSDKEIGFKEDATGIIKYFIDDTGTYRINMDSKETLENLYSNFDSSYLNLSMLFDNLSEYLYSVEKNGNVRTITYNKDGYKVTVSTDTENITNIIIVADTTIYDLKFTKIGECAKIDFTS